MERRERLVVAWLRHGRGVVGKRVVESLRAAGETSDALLGAAQAAEEFGEDPGEGRMLRRLSAGLRAAELAAAEVEMIGQCYDEFPVNKDCD